MEAMNDSLKYAAQAKELLMQHCTGKSNEEVDGVMTSILLLDKIIDSLTSKH